MSAKQVPAPDPDALKTMLAGKTAHTLSLFHHFAAEFRKIGDIQLLPAKTMIGIANANKRVAYVTRLGKDFVHIVFPFRQPYHENLCFHKIAQVPGDHVQFNHHLRMYAHEDVNEEVRSFMALAFREERKP